MRGWLIGWREWSWAVPRYFKAVTALLFLERLTRRRRETLMAVLIPRKFLASRQKDRRTLGLGLRPVPDFDLDSWK
jgi:hypothetical protein